MITAIFLGLSWIMGFNAATDTKNKSIELKTHQIKLTYSPETDPEYSLSLEYYIAHLGLIDITKLYPKEEIESLNIMCAVIPSTSFKAQVIMIDANRNGRFEYDSTDWIGLTSFNEQFRIENVNFSRSGRPITLKVDTEIYELQFKEDGSSITLTKTEAETSQADLTFPYRLPDMEVRALTKNARLNKPNGKYTYVEFWGTWCKPCIQIIPEIQSLKQSYGEKVNIISVDYYDNDMERVKEYIVKYKMHWDHLVGNKALIREFANPSYPCGVLFDPNGNLVEYKISPAKVGEILKLKD